MEGEVGWDGSGCGTWLTARGGVKFSTDVLLVGGILGMLLLPLRGGIPGQHCPGSPIALSWSEAGELPVNLGLPPHPALPTSSAEAEGLGGRG